VIHKQHTMNRDQLIYLAGLLN